MGSGRASSNIEGKYTVDVSDTLVLSLLQSLCQQDPEYPSDYVNSLYYDTPDLALLGQKADSDFRKNKVRLRWYGNPTEVHGPVTAYLEIKQKDGVQRSKVRKRFEVDSELLLPGKESLQQLTGYVDSLSEMGWAHFGALFPMIVIRYHRHRFTDSVSGARIALDRGIGFTKVNSIFFPDHGPRTLNDGVLEIKSSTGEIPRGMMPVKNRINMRDSFSKYEECWNMYSDISYRRELTSLRHE